MSADREAVAQVGEVRTSSSLPLSTHGMALEERRDGWALVDAISAAIPWPTSHVLHRRPAADPPRFVSVWARVTLGTAALLTLIFTKAEPLRSKMTPS